VSAKIRPTVDELYATLKNSSIPTVLVEGVDDIIFYRRVEEDLRDLGIDMLPAGNKWAVLELKERIRCNPIKASVAFVVDKDLWVYDESQCESEVITTEGYSIENDIFCDGDLLSLMTQDEQIAFEQELQAFVRWYALSVKRSSSNSSYSFRLTPHAVLADQQYYSTFLQLNVGEVYPEDFFCEIKENYGKLLRGKSLFALLVRQLSARQRKTKFGVNQLMEFGASRKGERYQRIKDQIRTVFAAA
jgi:hypothetical protein